MQASGSILCFWALHAEGLFQSGEMEIAFFYLVVAVSCKGLCSSNHTLHCGYRTQGIPSPWGEVPVSVWKRGECMFACKWEQTSGRLVGLNTSSVCLRKGLVNSPLMNQDVPCGDCVLIIIALLSNKKAQHMRDTVLWSKLLNKWKKWAGKKIIHR